MVNRVRACSEARHYNHNPQVREGRQMRLYRHWARLWGFSMALLLIGGNLSSAQAQRTGAGDPRPPQRVAGVIFTQDTLSVDVQDEDFGAIFRDIASQAQIEVSNLDGLPARRISTQFTDLSLIEGLKRLLRVAEVAGYALITAHTEDGVKIERILFLNDSAGSDIEPRSVAAAPRIAARRARRVAARSERARSRTAAPSPREKDSATSVFEDLKSNPETERLLSQVVHPNEQVREQAIEGLMRLASSANKQRDLVEALEPYMDDLRHGDEETREEAREDIRAMLRR